MAPGGGDRVHLHEKGRQMRHSGWGRPGQGRGSEGERGLEGRTAPDRHRTEDTQANHLGSGPISSPRCLEAGSRGPWL